MIETLNDVIITLFIFLFVLFLYLHVHFQLKTSNELEIYEIDQELSKQKMEEICDLRQPIVMDTTEELSQLIPIINRTNILREYSSYEIKIRNKNNIGTSDDLFIPLQVGIAEKLFTHDNTNNYYSENNNDFLNESNLLKIINENDFIIKPHLCCNSSYDIIFGSSNVEIPLRYEHNYRNYIMSTEGNIIVRLIPPKYNKYCDVETDYENMEYRSEMNVWEPQEKYKMIMKKIKYLDVELSVGRLLYIPAYWLYSVKFVGNSCALMMKYRTYMNMLAISPSLVMSLLQNQNIKTNYLKKMELETMASKKDAEVEVNEEMKDNEKVEEVEKVEESRKSGRK